MPRPVVPVRGAGRQSERTIMRRPALVALVLVLVASSVEGQSPPATPRPDEPATKFERFLLQKGAVRVREFHPIGSMQSSSGNAEFHVARAFTPGQADHVIALRVSLKEGGRVPRDRIGLLDFEEAGSLVSALPQMERLYSQFRQNRPAHHSEVVPRWIAPGGVLRVTEQ